MSISITYQSIKGRINLHKLGKYFIGGSLAASLDLVILYGLTEYFDIYYVYSQIVAFFMSCVFGFYFQKYISFQDRSSQYIRQMWIFILFQLIGLGINILILRLLTEQFLVHYIISSIIAKFIVFVRNFAMNSKFNFK